MPAFPLTADLTVNIFRTEAYVGDNSGLSSPLWAVREFDMKVLRIHSSRRYPRKVRSGPSEQSIRAAIRQAMLNLKLRIEQAQKHEIRVLKDQNILGKRAPSCTLLNSFDTIKLLKAFGKKKCGKIFKEAVSGAYPHLTEALEVEWATPIPKHHRAVLEADFGSSDDNDEGRDGEFGPDLGGPVERRAESEEEEEERRKARQAATQGFHPAVSRAPQSRAAREAAAAAAKLAASAEADEDSDHMVLSEIDYARNRVRAIASRRRMMLQHSHSFSVAAAATAAAEASSASTPSPSSSPTPSASESTETSLSAAAAASSSPSSTPSSSPTPPTPSSVSRGLTPSKRARTLGPASLSISISAAAAAAAAAASMIDSDDDSVAPDTPPLSDNEIEFLRSTSNPRFAPKRSFVPRFRPAASASSSAAYASASVVSPVASDAQQLMRKLESQRWELDRFSSQQHQHKRPRDVLTDLPSHAVSPVDSMHVPLTAATVHGAHLHPFHSAVHAFPLHQHQPAPLF